MSVRFLLFSCISFVGKTLDKFFLEKNTKRQCKITNYLQSHAHLKTIRLFLFRYVFGGMDIYSVENADYLDCLWQFCFTTEKWTPIRRPKQPKFLAEHSALVKGNKMYIFGGEFKMDKQSNALFEFNFINQKWKKLSGGTSKTFNVGAPEIRKRALFWNSSNKHFLIFFFQKIYFHMRNVETLELCF